MFKFLKPDPKSGVKEALQYMAKIYNTPIDNEHLNAFSALQSLAPRLEGFTKENPLKYGGLQLWISKGTICLHFEGG